MKATASLFSLSSVLLASLAISLALTSTVKAQRETFETPESRQARVRPQQDPEPNPERAEARPEREDRDALAARIAQGTQGRSQWRKGVNAAGKKTEHQASENGLAFNRILFKLDSTEFRDRSSELIVEEMAAALQTPQLLQSSFLIEGHTCDLGDADYNLNLSARRAAAVKSILVRYGVSPDRLAILGLGQTEPAIELVAEDKPSQMERKREQNRRVILRKLAPNTQE